MTQQFDALELPIEVNGFTTEENFQFRFRLPRQFEQNQYLGDSSDFSVDVLLLRILQEDTGKQVPVWTILAECSSFFKA